MKSDDYLTFGVSPERIEKWVEKREIQRKKDNGFLKEDRILYYSDIYDLKVIITKNWEKFKPILGNKQRFDVFFDEVQNFRNTISHGRHLPSFQENLLNGIFFDLKQHITIFYNRNEMKDDYFVRILRATDNFGNVWYPKQNILIDQFREGDQLEIYIEAFDPKNREIKYRMTSLVPHIDVRQKMNKFIVTLTREQVGPTTILEFSAYTPDAGYYNSAQFDVHITVLPKEY